MRLARLILIDSILTLLMVGNAEAENIDVAVAANFTVPAREIAASFKQKAGHEAVLSFGASGQLYSQSTHGAPFNVFLSADDPRPSKLVENGLAVPESRFTLAIGNLVLWSSTPTFVNDAETFAKLSIYNPAAARCGAAAVHAMKALGVCESTQPTLVAGLSPFSGADARSPSPLLGSWSDRFCTRCLSWCSRSGTSPLPSWLAAGMVMFGLAVVLAAALIEKCSKEST
ncbi:molybdate ABC transporter substrate-binding protein [Bradyrhizobium sp. CNPSo 4026]|nr:molybdate ABC transporter substrate-binding protein [Bradyrhizobium cenepequi]